MTTNTRDDAMTTTIKLDGDLTIYAAAETHKQFMVALRDGRDIEISLADVTDIDSAGIQLLVLLKRECAALGRLFSLRAPSAAVLDALKVMHLDSYFSLPTHAR